TVADAAYVAPEAEGCQALFAFELAGQQNLLLRGRASGAGVVAVNVDSEVEGPNAVVDFVAVGKGARVRGGSFFATGTLFDNVRLVDPLGQPAGEIELRLGPLG